MRRLAQIIIRMTMMLLAGPAIAQTTGDASNIADVAGDYHALVIGNNDYEHLGDQETDRAAERLGHGRGRRISPSSAHSGTTPASTPNASTSKP